LIDNKNRITEMVSAFINKFSKSFFRAEKGQALVIVALLFAFAFLALAALAIDGTIINLRRRQLQNAADSAALAAAVTLSQHKADDDAFQAARDSIVANGGNLDWHSANGIPQTSSDTTGNVGSGVGLSTGIEITGGCDVRVALKWSDIGTYFAQFIGRSTLEVGAKARAGCNRSGGLNPIAVKRFGDQRDWDLTLTNVNAATVYCDDCSTQQSLVGPPAQGLSNTTDFLRPSGVDTLTEWPGWPDGTALYQPPSPHADLAAGTPGREYFILGSGVVPNVGTTSYAGMINLDIRHVSALPHEYYNGVDEGTQSNTLKDLAEYYIRRGYCCDIPSPGDQVAVYNGNSTAFAAQAFQETYAIGDVVAVIVYNGHVFDTPNLAVTGDTPNYQFTYPTTTTVSSNALAYSIQLEAQNGFQSSASGMTTGVEGLDGFANWSLSSSAPTLGFNGITQQTLTLSVTPTLTTTTVGTTTTTHVVTGTRMFYVSFYDNKTGGTGIKRYWAGIATIGDEVNSVQRTRPEVTCTPTNTEQTYPFLSVVKGQQAKYSLELDVWGVGTDQSATVSAGSLPAGFEWVNAPPWTKTAKWDQHAGISFNTNIKVTNSAIASATPYVIPLTVSVSGMIPQTCNLYVLVEEAQTNVKEYVEILGYAALEITGYYNAGNPVTPGNPANAVRGRIVSTLMTDPSELTYGLRARLIPWD
jgi:Flp pilus assembly protein TadG